MTAPTGAPAPAPPAMAAPVLAPPVGRAAGLDGELAISMLLRAGTVIAGLLLVAGLLAAAVAGRSLHPGGLAPARLFRLEAEWPELLAGTGLLALCATPIARVAVTAGVFAIARERGPAWVAAGVLALLLAGIALGGLH